ncbi:hypothetical protein EVAR_7344_1 [Eumeta japonica]|uniref:HTH CENPB-type domain-containing protein n=1 Tax=Eumeta variegata TaxID=151549 RepID=A0A4C1T5Q9_EUMVA|nr:hypothetical protein EVAR_7344_1 [Eumeta japonica]
MNFWLQQCTRGLPEVRKQEEDASSLQPQQSVRLHGKHPCLDFDNEERLVKHILKLGDAGFPPNRQSIRMLAYQFAEKLELKHNFDHENEMAGAAWFKSFNERNPKLSFRQAEGLSVARAKGLSRKEHKPAVVLETTVAAESEDITQKVLIIKGVNKKPEFEEGLPMGSKVYMNKKSAYINAALFYKWLTEHFIPLKPHETNQFVRLNPNKKISRYNAGKLICNAWIRTATPANALVSFKGSGIYPVDQNALPDTIFMISDTALNSENPGTSRAPHQVDRTSTTQAQTSYSLDRQPEESPKLSIDSKILEGISNFDSGDYTIAEILGSDIEPETPSKILIEASPIPKIPLTMSKSAKQSANILNLKENIKQKKDVAERKEKQIETKLDKKSKTETTKEKRVLKKTKKQTSNKERQQKKRKALF